MPESIAAVEPAESERRWRRAPLLAAAVTAAIAFLAGPLVAVGGLVVILLTPRWRWLPVAVVLVAGSVAAGYIVAAEWWYDYPPGPDWPSRFGWTAPLVWMAVTAVTVTAIMPDGVRRRG